MSLPGETCSGACPVCCAYTSEELALANRFSDLRVDLADEICALVDRFRRKHKNITTDEIRGALLDISIAHEEMQTIRRAKVLV